MKKIRTNPNYNFFFRIFLVLVFSILAWSFIIIYYYENKLASDVQAEIEKSSYEYKGQFNGIDFINKNQAYKDFIEYINKESKKKKIASLSFYNKNKELVFKLKNFEIPKILENKKNSFVSEMSYELLPSAYNEAYLYFEDKIYFDDNSFYYLDSLIKIDKQIVSKIKDDTFYTLFVVVITTLIICIFIFPLLYKQYKKLLDKKDELLLSNLSTLSSLGNAIAKRDSDTNAHNYRVTYYSLKLALEIDLENKQMEALIKGAFLHDIGKIAISDNILLKPGKLNKEEFEIMKTHVEHGIDIVNDIPWLEDAKDVIYNHHEKVNGLGYPRGLRGEQIPLVARIFAIADVFDALSSKRPYKEPMPLDNCITILKADAGSHFDKNLVEVFERIYKKIYKEVANKDEKALEELLKTLLKPYFHF